MKYVNRGFEWIRTTSLFADAVRSAYGPAVEVEVAFSNLPTLGDQLYSPRRVFTDFSVDELLRDCARPCPCHHPWFDRFRDTKSLDEYNGDAPAIAAHLRTMDLRILPNKGTRKEMSGGLSHIPMEPTTWKPIGDQLKEAWESIGHTLTRRYPLVTESTRDSARRILMKEAKLQFDNGYTTNRGQHRCMSASIMTDPITIRFFESMSKVAFWSGIDKAANTWMVRCIRHERLQALQRLTGHEFVPVVDLDEFVHDYSAEAVMSYLTADLENLIPELTLQHTRLPYLFSLFKMHKLEHRWLVNAHDCVFSETAMIVQVTTEAALQAVRGVCGREDTHADDPACSFPAVSSMYEVILNLPEEITSVFAADITRCFEAIPTTDVPDSLQTPVRWVFETAFGEHRGKVLCVKWSTTKHRPLHTTWTRHCPPDRHDYIYMSFDVERIIALSVWLMTHAFTVLGDRTWLQRLGIAMGFACSPVWCTAYLLYYEYRFIARLRRLGLTHILRHFRDWYRYIDDVLWVSYGIPHNFFFHPDAPRVESNPFWIYPLNILSVKPTVETWLPSTSPWVFGKQVHYLSFTLTVEEEGGSTMTRYIKRDTLPFETVTFLAYRSNRRVAALYGTPVGQVVPYLYVHSNAGSAKISLTKLVNFLIDVKGFPEARLVRTINDTLRGGQYPGLLYDHSDICIRTR